MLAMPPRDHNPFGEILGITWSKAAVGSSLCHLKVRDELMNPHKVLHGGVAYSLADTGMGAAVLTTLEKNEECATRRIEIVYQSFVEGGDLRCETQITNRRGQIIDLESKVTSNGVDVARAKGRYAVFPTRESSA